MILLIRILSKFDNGRISLCVYKILSLLYEVLFSNDLLEYHPTRFNFHSTQIDFNKKLHSVKLYVKLILRFFFFVYIMLFNKYKIYKILR